MGRDVLWLVVAAIGMAIVIALSNAGPASAANAAFTLGFGGGFLALGFRSVWRTERRVLGTQSPWTPSTIVASGFVGITILQLLGSPAWMITGGALVTAVGSWVRGAQLLRRSSHQRAAP